MLFIHLCYTFLMPVSKVRTLCAFHVCRANMKRFFKLLPYHNNKKIYILINTVSIVSIYKYLTVHIKHIAKTFCIEQGKKSVHKAFQKCEFKIIPLLPEVFQNMLHNVMRMTSDLC